jgi:S-adenosylmethionine decarboxylase
MSAPFNHLTKCLRFNLYDFAVTRTVAEKRSYAGYVRRHFSSTQIAETLVGVAKLLGAEVLNVSKQKASVNVHLDKSHICAHTCLDTDDPGGVSTFRVDVDIATCGGPSPLHALDYLLAAMQWRDVVVLDYMVRGFAREGETKIWMDHDLETIRSHIDPKVLEAFHYEEFTWAPNRVWQTRLLRMEYDRKDYFAEGTDLSTEENLTAFGRLETAMRQVFHA